MSPHMIKKIYPAYEKKQNGSNQLNLMPGLRKSEAVMKGKKGVLLISSQSNEFKILNYLLFSPYSP